MIVHHQLLSDAGCSNSLHVTVLQTWSIVRRAAYHCSTIVVFRGFTAAVLSKPAKSIRQQHPGLVSAVQMLFTPILRFPPIANRQDQVKGSCCSKLACQ